MGCCQGTNLSLQEIGQQPILQPVKEASQLVQPEEIDLIESVDKNDNLTPQIQRKRKGKLQKRKSARNFIKSSNGSVNKYYKITKKLGEGSYGKVFQAYNCHDNTIRAIKIISKCELSSKERKSILREINILKNLNHPHIIKIIEVIEDEQNLCIVTEYCSGGELFQRIIHQRQFTESQAAEYMYNILSAVLYCHRERIVHRDLKPENIIFESQNNDAPLKVIDFGFSAKKSKVRNFKSVKGSPYYIAPEVLRGDYDEKCDIWSCGVILYMLLSGTPPFNGKNDVEIYQAIVKGKYSLQQRQWESVSGLAKQLIQNMLKYNSTERFSAEQAFNSPWIQKHHHKLFDDSPIMNITLQNLANYTKVNKFKQAILEYIASFHASFQNLKDFQVIFVEMDKDNDGYLSREELEAGFSKIQNLGFYDVNQVLDSCDGNGDGCIDYTEFLTAMINWQRFLDDEKLLAAFRAIDSDGSGTISLQELQQFGGFNQDDTELLDLWNQADMNGDGELDIQEFKEAIMKRFEIEKN